jgi:hypothetical protein
MKLRSAGELAATADPGWPHVLELIAEAAVPVQVVPPTDATAGARTLSRLQVTTRSTLGALAINCGAMLVDHGWLRLLGCGLVGLADLAEANGLGEPSPRTTSPGHLVVGYDVLGGTFAVNGGGLPGDPGEVCYFGPDTLTWTPIGLSGHSALLQWALAGGLAGTFADLRWPSWQPDVSAVAPGQGLFVYPPLWAAEARSSSTVKRSAVPMTELLGSHQEFARQLADVNEGSAVRVQITED